VKLRLPATSANLGPAFDAAALALDRWLTIEATESIDAAEFSISATGLNADICGRVEGNLILDTYTATLLRPGQTVPTLSLSVDNQIPLGMGMGSSAAARLAGVALAAHFGKLGWSSQQVLEEACRLEKHPDNAAACWLGGFVTAVTAGEHVLAAKFVPPPQWTAIVVLPRNPLATESARAVLPEQVSRKDAVANLQRSALLTAAFAQGRGDWLEAAMRDKLHQPYRSELCPLLPRLLPLSGGSGVMGVALSGAGPAVLLLVESPQAASAPELHARIHTLAEEPVELLVCGLVSDREAAS
jgi:homoserine kinase